MILTVLRINQNFCGKFFPQLLSKAFRTHCKIFRNVNAQKNIQTDINGRLLFFSKIIRDDRELTRKNDDTLIRRALVVNGIVGFAFWS